MTDDEILGTIAEVARKHLAWSGELRPDTPLVEAFDLDSVRQLTLVIELEDRFRIRLDGEDEQAISSVGDLVDVIRRNLAAAAGNDR